MIKFNICKIKKLILIILLSFNDYGYGSGTT